jgi:hypothetical protein
MIRKRAMRWALTALLMLSALDAALGADKAVAPHAKRHAKVILPAGLPRPHYNYRTTVVYAPAAPAPVYVEDPPLLTPPPTTPLLPGSSTLPGYYGRPFNYYYQGAYYGDDGGSPGYSSYFFRLPYACGVTGYC